MKRFIVAFLSLVFANLTLAQPALEDCTEVPKLAADVMARRQVNYDIMLMINRMNGELNDNSELLRWAEAMIDMAYSQGVAATPEERAKQVQDFQTLWLERCLNKMPK